MSAAAYAGRHARREFQQRVAVPPKSIHVSRFGQVAFLLGAGHSPTHQYQYPGDDGMTYVFTWRAAEASEQYFALRDQLRNTPTVAVPAAK